MSWPRQQCPECESYPGDRQEHSVLRYKYYNSTDTHCTYTSGVGNQLLGHDSSIIQPLAPGPGGVRRSGLSGEALAIGGARLRTEPLALASAMCLPRSVYGYLVYEEPNQTLQLN